MNITITYETALARHPMQVAEILKDLAKSRSKDKDMDPTHYKWEYSWCISVKSCSFADILSGKGQEPETRTLEERIGFVSLYATKGRKYGCAATGIKDPLPPEVLAWHEEQSKPRPPNPELDNPTVPELIAKLPGLVVIALPKPEE